MSITAKVRLASKVQSGADDDPNRTAQLTFAADYTDGRNKEWAAATPALSLVMTVRGDVADRFEPGRAFTLTFDEDAPAS
jgi:hypothetical protein